MSESLNQLPATDPSMILRFRDRQFAAELLATAILRFDFFTWLDIQGAVSLKNICSQFSWASRPADVLLTLCRASGLVVHDSNGLILLSDLGREYLVTGSLRSLVPYFHPIADSNVIDGFESVLKTNKPANWQAKEEGDDWHGAMKDEAFAEGFTQLMNCRGITFGQSLASALSQAVANKTHVLDVGGGSGIYSATLIARYPHLRGTVLEQPPVDSIARKEISTHGLSDRIDVVSGNMFEDAWPDDAGIVLLSNVLHDWDFPEVEKLIDRAVDALADDGVIVVHEAFIDDDKMGPLPVAEYSALLMHITQGKCYSVAEYADLFRQRGFVCSGHQPTIADRGFFIASRAN